MVAYKYQIILCLLPGIQKPSLQAKMTYGFATRAIQKKHSTVKHPVDTQFLPILKKKIHRGALTMIYGTN